MLQANCASYYKAAKDGCRQIRTLFTFVLYLLGCFWTDSNEIWYRDSWWVIERHRIKIFRKFQWVAMEIWQHPTLRTDPGSLGHRGQSQAASDTEDGARQPRTLRTEPGSRGRWVMSRNVMGSACVTSCVTQCQNLWQQMSRTLSLSARNVIIIELWRL